MSNLLIDKRVTSLLDSRKGVDLFITVGNTLRSDDGIGPYIASRIVTNDNLLLIDAQNKPENIIEEVISIKPDRLIFIDASNFGGVPGEIRLIDEDIIPQTTVTTHMIPLSVVSKIITQDIDVEVFFIGIQIKSAQLGEELSPEIKVSADKLIKIINQI